MIEVIDNALPESIFKEFYPIVTKPLFPWYLGNDINKNYVEFDNDNPRGKVISVTPSATDDKDITGICFDKNTIPSFQFFHLLYDMFDTPKINSPHFDLFNKPIFDFLRNSKKIGGTLFRSKLNLLTNNHNIKSNNFHNIPHIDIEKPHISVLLYLNNSDGDTVFFNERYDEKKEKPKSISIKQKISPKENRMVISDGNYHCSTNPINTDYRIVYNAVLLIDE